MSKLTIDIGVGGRFHSDHMAEAMLEAGHDVRLFTSIPKSRFPMLPSSKVFSLLWPEVVFRLAKKGHLENYGDLFKMRVFGKKMAERIEKEQREVDLFLGWSSFVLETFGLNHAKTKVVIRDSAHILFQNEVLKEEYKKYKIKYPNRELCVDREVAEYEQADRILLLSEFAKRTFLDRGIQAEKLKILRLGVDTSLFRPAENYNVQLPLKVLYFGALSIQKGIQYLLEATREFSPKAVKLYLVGSVDDNFRSILKRYDHARVIPAMPQDRLSKLIREMDVFIFPSLHDGFGQVLVQAMSSGLVPIVSDHCGAAEVVSDGKNGFVVPAGNASAITQCLFHLVEDLKLISRIREEVLKIRANQTWDDYKRELMSWIEEITEGGAASTQTSYASTG